MMIIKVIMWQDYEKVLLFLYIACINIIAWIMYGIDKKRAMKGKWRIPEKTLLGAAMLGGSFGAIMGMYLFHHKKKHWKFRILVPIFLILHIMLLLVLFL